jgi:hypothetical protein
VVEDGELEGLVDVSDEGLEEGISRTRLARRRRKGLCRNADGELGGPVDGSDEELEEDPLLELGLLEGDEEGCAKTLGDADGELEGPVDGTDEGLDEGPLL